jgi:hypothetical protein
MTQRFLASIGACCLTGIVLAAVCAFAVFTIFRHTSTQLAPARRVATSFATSIGSGDDARAYGMLAPPAQREHPRSAFCAYAAEARKTLGGFRAEPPPAVASENLQVHNDDWRCSTTLLLRGEKARGTASVDLTRTGNAPWRIRNWSWARADAR